MKRSGQSAGPSCTAPLVLIALSVLLSGCNPGISGIYTDVNGATQYEFRPDGQVYIRVFGATASGNYEANADRILISGPQGTVVLVRKQDKLQGPMGLELTRKQTG